MSITLPDKALLAVGGAVIAVLAFLAKIWLENAFKAQMADIKKENQEGREEREYDTYVSLLGQQATASVCHELVACVKTGKCNGELEQASHELEEYRKLSRELMAKKAAKYNIRMKG